MAKEFARRGHLVAGCCRSATVVEELRPLLPAPHRVDIADISVDAQVRRWSESVLREWGPPDLLINSAAVINENEVLWRISPDDFSTIVDINIKGVFLVIRHFVPAMVKRGKGVIVNFSSGWGRSTSPEVAPYCATKWAVEGLTRALAQELPQGMAAVPLNPGIINTDMLASCFGGEAASYRSPEEWARQAVPFLLDLGPRQNGRPLTAP